MLQLIKLGFANKGTAKVKVTAIAPYSYPINKYNKKYNKKYNNYYNHKNLLNLLPYNLQLFINIKTL